MINYLLFVVGFIFLIKGADFLIKGASAISKKYKVPEITIGLTVVALGTSLPELMVNIFASVSGESDLIIGNIAGSNVANTLLVLGIGALFTTLIFSKSSFKIDLPFSLGTVVLLLLLVFSQFWIFQEMTLSRFHGMILLALFVGYLFVIFKRKEEFVEEIETLSLKKALVLIFLGAIGLFLGGEWVVAGAINIATLFGLSTMFIGSSIIAIGTALPELVTIIISTLRNKHDLAIGNIIGSNIFNVLLVLGVSSLIRPITFSSLSNINFLFVILSMGVVMLFLFNQYIRHKKYALKRVHGVFLLLLYVFYLAYFFYR